MMSAFNCDLLDLRWLRFSACYLSLNLPSYFILLLLPSRLFGEFMLKVSDLCSNAFDLSSFNWLVKSKGFLKVEGRSFAPFAKTTALLPGT